MASFAISRVFLLAFHRHLSTDLNLYLLWLRRKAEGQVPYADFPIEYPPLAWWVIQLPGTTEALAYYARFRLLMGVADLAAFLLLGWLSYQRRAAAVLPAIAAYVGTTMLLEFVLYDRLDIVMAALVLAALAAWIRAAASARAAVWRTIAYVAIAVGAAYKLIPIVVLPFMALSDLRTEGRWQPVAMRLGLCVLILGAPIAATSREAGLATLDFFGYHAARGIEVESVWATVMWLASAGDDSLHIVSRFGSWELAGASEAIVAKLAAWGMVGVFVTMTMWALALRGRFGIERAYLQALLLLPGLLVVSKVFSPQYLLWVLPLLMLGAIELTGDRNRRRPLAVAVSCVILAGLTTAFYPLGRRYVDPLNGWIMALLAVRNVIYVGVVAWLFVLAFVRDFSTPAPGRVPVPAPTPTPLAGG